MSMHSAALRVAAFDARLDSITQADALQLAMKWRAQPGRRTQTIVTVNVAILMMLRSNPALKHAIDAADLVVADGMPLVWASRWLGHPVPERVTGVDLMEALLAKGAEVGLRVFLLGTTQERLDRLVRVITERYPGVVIVGAQNGFFDRKDDAALVETIRESRADLLLVGMPAPFKEIWCEQHRTALCTPVVLGVGGAFDVMAGFVPRAPKALQNAGLEWAWRLFQEPRKLWRRYLETNVLFVALLVKELASKRLFG